MRKIRFRTHMILAASTLTALTVVIMTLLLLMVAITSLGTQFQERGVLVTKLVTRNLEYGLGLPNRVMERVSEQMVVSALLAAELVALGEQSGNASPETLSNCFRRVIDRSKELHGYPLVNEFWVTDAEGRSYINSAGIAFDFPVNPADTSQASAFQPLLISGAPPIVQKMQPRKLDKQPFCYVGVTGVDHPRIVQVGVGEELGRSIRADFEAQNLLEQFISREKRPVPPDAPGAEIDRDPVFGHIDTDVSRIVLVSAQGKVMAEAGGAGAPDSAAADAEVLTFCRAFLADPREGFSVRPFGHDVGVATFLRDPVTGENQVLFMQHRMGSYFHLLSERIRAVAITGAFLILAAVLVSVWLGRRLSRPILELSHAARRLGQGDLGQRIHIDADREFETLAEAFNHMAGSLQHHMRELEEQTQRRERLESELRIAAEQQRSLLPVHPPAIAGLDVAGFSLAAREVGGDFYDFFDLGEGRFAAAIGDATDKGLPAAMLITECWSVLRALIAETDSPAELLQRINRALYARIGDSGRFVTLFLMIIDTRRGILRYSMAGHLPPCLLGEDPARKLRLGSAFGLPLGIEADCTFEDVEVRLCGNDTILLYSDGITEAFAPDYSLYGESRLHLKFAEWARLPLNELLEAIREDVASFTHCHDPEDDCTAVAIRFCSGAMEAAACPA